MSELWTRHQALARQVAAEVIAIQQWLTGTELRRERPVADMVNAIDADPEHRCTGRAAPAPLVPALYYANEAGLPVPKLRDIEAGR